MDLFFLFFLFNFFVDLLVLRVDFFHDPCDVVLELELELELGLELELELELESSLLSELEVEDVDTCSIRVLTGAVLGMGCRGSNEVLLLVGAVDSSTGLNSAVPGGGFMCSTFSLIMPRIRRRRLVNPARMEGLSGRSLGVRSTIESSSSTISTTRSRKGGGELGETVLLRAIGVVKLDPDR
jgi:hypothetical protein